MTTVDDLRISVSIDETSNLGNLQKQLTALVGKKGDKQIDLGALDTSIKRDLQIIKDGIVKFTPTVLVGENIKEAALNLGADLKTNKNLTKVTLQRYGINIDKYESFIQELFNITRGFTKMNSDQQKGFIAEMTKFRMIVEMKGGDRETLVKRLTRMMLEAGFHEKLIDIFREANIKLLSKPPMFELTKKSIGKSFKDVIKQYESETEFVELKEIFDRNSDALIAITEAYEHIKGDVFDITEVTQDMIENDQDLRMIIVAQVASALKKSNWMVEQFYKSGKDLFTKGKSFAVAGPAYLDTVVHGFSKRAMEQLGIKHIVGSEIDENMVNFLGELKTVAGKSEVNYELTKRAIKQGYNRLFFFVEEYTDEAKNTIEEFLEKEEHKGKKIGLYQLLPRTVKKLLGIEIDLDELEKTARASLEKQKEDEKEEISEEDQIMAALQDLDDITDDIKEVEGESTEEIKKAQLEEQRQLDELMKAMGELKETTDDTNAEVKKKDINNDLPVEKEV